MQTLVNILLLILNVYEIILLARVLMSWFRPDPYNPIVRFLYNATEPILAPIREALPATGGIDFSPLVAFLLLFALQRVITILL
ncbi:MAG TPA: YggT family protein [Aggregatilineales bacterium]|nr:YggT family protein [Aggregatilineales bacterium]HPV07724.1 YggT family protein [Aggregatilineales bacterium]HQA69168.1 YggT family protein [Aggregatilineales bacterium]HQE20200.1 YggT family protein [Aggregatilineales bacterium]